MRIVLVNNYFVPRPTGSAHLTEGLARRFAEAGHEVLVVTSAYEAEPREERRDGYLVVRLPARDLPRSKLSMNYNIAFVLSIANCRMLRRLLNDFDPDIVHAHGQFFDLSWMAACWSRQRGVPLVLTVHTALVHTRRTFAAVFWVLDQVIVRPTLALGRPTVITIDKFIDRYVRRRYHLPDERIRWVAIGVDTERFFTANGDLVRARHNLVGRPIILSVGHVIPLRDRVLLVRALPFVLAQHPDAVLLVVGNVNDTRYLELADNLGVSAAVVSTGAVPQHEIPMYVAAADVECHDLQRYGLGTATIEVMAGGVPVVSVVDLDNFPGITLRPWIDVGVVADDPEALADGIVQLLRDAAFRERLGKTQREFVIEHFSIDSVAQRHLALYQQLIA